jgi:hypothetical protein
MKVRAMDGKNVALLLIALCVGGYVSLPIQTAYASSSEADAEAYDIDGEAPSLSIHAVGFVFLIEGNNAYIKW